MSQTPTKKSVFDRIGSSGGNLSSSSGTTNNSTKSTHGFCSAFIKTGLCSLGDNCKFIHVQPNFEKTTNSKDEFRITKTITQVVDMSSPPIKSTVTVSSEQRSISNPIQSTRTVIESSATSSEQSDRRMSHSDRKQSQNRRSDSKSKSSSKKKSQLSSHEKHRSSNKRNRSNESDSTVSSNSDSEYTRSSHKHKKKSDTHSTSSKHKKHESISPNRDDDETVNNQTTRQTQSNTKSSKRTIVITDRKTEENVKRNEKDSKSKSYNDIEFLGSKKINRDKKPIETIHQQAENTKKSIEIKREKKSPSKSSSEQQRRNSSSTNNSNINEKSIQIKIEANKTQNPSERSEKSDRNISQSTPPVVQLSPTPPFVATSETIEKESFPITNEPEKSTQVQPPSPVCVILLDDSSPTPSVEKKVVRQTATTPIKKSNESDKTSSKPSKRSRDYDKTPNKEKSNENSETKRKRLNDDNSKKISSSSKSGNDNRSTSNRSDNRRDTKTSSSRDESSTRKYQDKSESKTSRSNDSKDRSLNSLSKTRTNTERRETTKSSPEKKRTSHRHGKEKGLENVTDSEEHLDEPVLPKQTPLEAYVSMDWSLLSSDKRIPLNTQTTSRIARIDNSNNSIGVFCERLLTNEQKEKLNGIEFHSLPLTNYIKELQTKPITQIINSCNRRFGSCAKDMIDMRHKWFIKSNESIGQYEFINKDHYLAFQQAINSFLDKTSNEPPTVQIETTTADVLLS